MVVLAAAALTARGDPFAVRDRLASSRRGRALPAGPADPGLFRLAQDRRARACHGARRRGAPLRPRRQGRPTRSHRPTLHASTRSIRAVSTRRLAIRSTRCMPVLSSSMGLRGAHGVFYDNLAIGEVDLGCTIDNYHGLFRSYRARRRRSRLLRHRRAARARRGAALFLADRRPGLRAALVARLRA